METKPLSWEEYLRVWLQSEPFGSPWIFRGQADTRWSLATTLDRERVFTSEEDRAGYQNQLFSQFRRLSVGLEHSQRDFPEGEALELLARHHGLPSMILDWTRSPFIAAYFAYESAIQTDAENVAVYAVPIVWLGEDIIPSMIELIDEPSLLWTNVRAVEQHSVFMRVRTREPLDRVLPGWKISLPSSEAHIALRCLSRMGIDSRSLFRNLDGAARCARNTCIINAVGAK